MPASAQAFVGVVGLSATVVSLVWATAGDFLRFAAPLASLALTLHMMFELRTAPRRRLRWDGAAWWLRAEQAGAGETCGDLLVACDLGDALLLHFIPAGGRWSRGGVWLPLQRSEVEGDWHGLRCALYSPRERPVVAASEALDV